LAAVRRLAPLLIAVLALAACGGSGNKSSNDEAQIKSAYEAFFSSKSSLADRVAVLQDGSRFKSVIQQFASNPLASNTSATVSKVTLHGTNNATVVYLVKFGGSSLPQQTGTAVRQKGKWKVGFAGLCKLVGLSGTTPSACKS
jgi:hypothetical protein